MDIEHTKGALNLCICGNKLEARLETVTSAIVYYHRFFEYASKNNEQHDRSLVAATCLYLAGKTEEEHLPIRDIINVFHHTLNGPNAKPLPLSDRYWGLRDSIVQMELLLLRALRFRVKIEPHPHRYLVHYLHAINEWKNFGVNDDRAHLLSLTSWTLLNDSYLNPKMITYDPVHIVIAVISIALDLTKIHLSDQDEDEDGDVLWYERFVEDLSTEDLVPIENDIMDAYIMAEKSRKTKPGEGPEGDCTTIDD